MPDALNDPPLLEPAGHVIVCGLHALGLRIVEVLRASEVPVVVVDDDPDPQMVSLIGRWGVRHVAKRRACRRCSSTPDWRTPEPWCALRPRTSRTWRRHSSPASTALTFA